MRAVVIVQGDEGGMLKLCEVPAPEPGSEELLVRVKATSLNRADLYQLKGTFATQTPAGGYKTQTRERSADHCRPRGRR